MKKMLRWQGIVLLMCLLTTSLLVGCKVMDDQQREDRLKELLRDKYGEEFEVRDMYVTERVEAWCYPANNPEIVFKITTSTDMDVISMDYYLQRLACKDLEEEIQPQLETIYNNCYVSAYFGTATTTHYYDYETDDVSLESLVDYYRIEDLSDSIAINIFIDKSKTDAETCITEYEKMINIILEPIERAGNSITHVKLYICDADEISEIRRIVGISNWDSNGLQSEKDIYDVINTLKPVWLLIDENKKIDIVDDDGSRIDFNLDIYTKQIKELFK